MLDTCPKSYVSAESEALVEEFRAWQRLGGLRLAELSARQVEAFVILSDLRNEQQHARTTHGRVPTAVRE